MRVKVYEADAQGVEKFIDYKRVFEILRGVHYNGFCSMVYEGTEDGRRSRGRRVICARWCAGLVYDGRLMSDPIVDY